VDDNGRHQIHDQPIDPEDAPEASHAERPDGIADVGLSAEHDRAADGEEHQAAAGEKTEDQYREIENIRQEIATRYGPLQPGKLQQSDQQLGRYLHQPGQHHPDEKLREMDPAMPPEMAIGFAHRQP